MTIRLHSLLGLLLGLTLLLCPGCSPDSPEKAETPRTKEFLAFGGGPTGGTFNFFASKMASIITADNEWLDVSPKGSGGSAENLHALNRGSQDFGIAYSGDAFLARSGRMPGDTTRYANVRAVSFLYGAPAQLVVRANSDIKTVEDLKGKTVAVGNPGSGAALAAERFFKHLNLWEGMTILKQGYSKAAQEFIGKGIDAFWVLVGYPNSAVIQAAARVPVRLIDLDDAATKSGFYKAYPFYTRTVIPAATYHGQESAAATFQDAALWCASASLSDQTVYDALQAVYTDQGLLAIAAAHKAGKGMSKANAIESVSIALHPGAVRYWEKQGVEIPAIMLP